MYRYEDLAINSTIALIFLLGFLFPFQVNVPMIMYFGTEFLAIILATLILLPHTKIHIPDKIDPLFVYLFLIVLFSIGLYVRDLFLNTDVFFSVHTYYVLFGFLLITWAKIRDMHVHSNNPLTWAKFHLYVFFFSLFIAVALIGDIDVTNYLKDAHSLLGIWGVVYFGIGQNILLGIHYAE